MSVDDEKYRKLRESLRALPRLKARGDFEARLHQRIREHENRGFEQHVKKAAGSSWIDMLANLFKPSLAPAIGLTVVLLAVIVVYFAYYNEIAKDKQRLLETSENVKKEEFVIYVKDDGERVRDETAVDIVSADTRDPSALYRTPTEHSTDADVKFFEQPVLDSEREKHDRITDEQKIMMEKESIETKSDDLKISPKKEDDGIHMKKTGKNDKGKEAPSNIRDEKGLDTGNKVEGFIKEQKANEELNHQEEDSLQKSEKERLARSRKDSLKVKDKELEDQKDSIEK